jgi:hypothetical protein
MRRVLLGSCLCVVVGFLIGSAAATAKAKPVEPCGSHVVASRYGITIVASRILVTATVYGKRRARRIWPKLGCQQVRSVVKAYLTAKLYRPLGQCTVPALKGYWCHVDHWLCSAEVPYASGPSAEQECLHEVIDRAGVLRRLAYVYFRETDNDHA